jgi:hypothetical protein
MNIVMTAGEETRTLDLNTMPIRDAMDCERLTSMSWVEWREALAQDRASAVAFAWWIAGKRQGVEVGKFSEVDLDLAQLRWSVELTDEEKGTEGETPEDEDGDDATIPTGPAEAETLTD